MLFSLLQASDLLPIPVGTSWVAVAGLAISLILAVIRVAEFVAARAQRATLSVSATRDLFFRYTTLGETVFVSSVMFTTEKPAIITDIRGVLRRSDGKKSFPLTFLKFGEPINRGTQIFDHYFFSSSPIDLLPVDVPVRRVYMCVLSEYEGSMKSAVTKLENEILALTPRIKEGTANPDQPDVELAAAINRLRHEFMSTFIDGVQLEQSSYVLELEYDYREPKRKATVPHETSKARVEFDIGHAPREVLRIEMGYPDYLVLKALGQGPDSYAFPEISPENVRPTPAA